MGIEMKYIQQLMVLHQNVFERIEAATGSWLPGLTARCIFGSVLMLFFVNSAMTKFAGGPFSLSLGAYAQVLPPIAEAAGYDPSKIAFFPWAIIVFLGAYAEIILPISILIGLFTRLSSLAMIGFIFVMTMVDINFHGVGTTTIGAMFDRVHDSAILDQRLLWLFPLVYLTIKGPGPVSVDYLLAKLRETSS
ncbi:MAG: DoxX family protein [Rhodospirillales bacterium]